MSAAAPASAPASPPGSGASPDDERPVPAPRANPRLEGQEQAEAMLRAALDSGRLAHAWILSGPRGVGKATLAYRLARYLFTAGRELSPPPGAEPGRLTVAADHPAAARVASGGHADLTAAGIGWDEKNKRWRRELVVDEIRRIPPFLRRTPAEGGWRVAVVDPAEAMNRHAQNAVLKILEEPPERAVLLLVCESPGQLIPTIRSRCRHLELAPLPAATVDSLLAEYCPDLEAQERAALARLSAGSIGRAVTLWARGGLDCHRALLAVLSAPGGLDRVAAHDLAERAGRDNGAAFDLIAELIQGWVTRVIRLAVRPEAEIIEIEPGSGEADSLRAAAARVDVPGWLARRDRLAELAADRDRAALNPRLVALTMLEALAA